MTEDVHYIGVCARVWASNNVTATEVLPVTGLKVSTIAKLQKIVNRSLSPNGHRHKHRERERERE
jgi:hypothetical protein